MILFMIKLIKNMYFSFIVVFFSSIFLQSCWLKKCEDPDAEHCSWTMIPIGRTEPMIFKSVSGKSDTFDVYQPHFNNLGSSLDVCTGRVYASGMFSPHNEDLVWSAVKYSNGNQEIHLIGLFSSVDSIIYKKDTLTSKFNKSPWSTLNLRSIKILKNAGIFQININDTIYNKVN